MSRPVIKVLCGLPASGKSFYTKTSWNREIILSSDELRYELFGDEDHQDDNDKVFEEMYKRTKEKLEKGINVFLDSTNISMKKRIALIERFKNTGCQFQVYYLNTMYSMCLLRNFQRKRVVPTHVIARMYKTLQIPQYNEGWDSIHIYTDSVNIGIPAHWFESQFFNNKLNYIQFCSTLQQLLQKEIFDSIYDVSQDSSYHSFSITRHIYHVWEYVLENYDTFNQIDREQMLWASVFHDVGKGFCKNFKEGNRYANFIGHENVSAQIAMFYLKSLGYSDNYALNVTLLVQNHMRLLNADSDKAKKKILDQVGLSNYRKLQFLRESDVQAK